MSGMYNTAEVIVKRTQMSYNVTGELIRNLANRKLKMSEVEPSGATYSAREVE